MWEINDQRAIQRDAVYNMYKSWKITLEEAQRRYNNIWLIY